VPGRAAAFGELLDDLGAECGQVVGIAAGHQAQVGHHFLVDPGAACVADVSGGSRFGPDAAKVSGMQARRTEAETIWLWLWRWLFD
jgi:hypothetical protein